MIDRQPSLNALADVLEEGLSYGDMARLLATIRALPRDLHVDAIDVIANVHHFISDGRVRKRDQDRRESQETEMRRLIDALREGRPREDLLFYHFLG